MEVLGPGSVILEDSQLSLRILGYVNHNVSDNALRLLHSEIGVDSAADLVRGSGPNE